MAKRRSVTRALVAVLAVYLLFLILQYFPPRIPGLGEVLGGDTLFHLSIAALSVICCLIAGGSLKRDLMLRPFRGRHLPAGLLLWVSAAIFMELLIRLITLWFPAVSGEGATLTAALSKDSLLYALFLTALVPAFCEELLFRGFMLSTLRRTMPDWVAALICAVLFALAHVSPARMLPMLLFGFFLSLAGCLSGSVWIPMIMHFVNNAFVVISVYFPKEAGAYTDLILGHGTWVSLLIAVVTGALGWWLMWGRSKK